MGNYFELMHLNLAWLEHLSGQRRRCFLNLVGNSGRLSSDKRAKANSCYGCKVYAHKTASPCVVLVDVGWGYFTSFDWFGQVLGT